MFNACLDYSQTFKHSFGRTIERLIASLFGIHIPAYTAYSSDLCWKNQHFTVSFPSCNIQLCVVSIYTILNLRYIDKKNILKTIAEFDHFLQQRTISSDYLYDENPNKCDNWIRSIIHYRSCSKSWQCDSHRVLTFKAEHFYWVVNLDMWKHSGLAVSLRSSTVLISTC